MREIIVLQVGGAGNQIGAKFWELISAEHGIDMNGNYAGQSELQRERLNVYYMEVSGRRYVPRSINVDLDPNSVQTLKHQPCYRLFRPDFMLSGKESGSNNFARCRYGDGMTMLAPTMEIVRKCAEDSDCMQGFQIMHAIGGGSGSGLNSLIMDSLKDEYPSRISNTFSIIPSTTLSEIVVENYNAIFSLSYLAKNSDETVVMDNEGLLNICRNTLNISGRMEDYNTLISECIGGVTACFRFPGQLNMDLRKLAVNMKPYEGLHFFAPSFVPLTSRTNQQYVNLNVPLLVQQMFDPKYMQAACEPQKGKYLCSAAIFRGLLSLSEIQECLYLQQTKNASLFLDSIPNCNVSAVCDIPPRGHKMACTFLANTTAISQVFERCLKGFTAMLKRKANIHWYLGEGMEEAEFYQAEDQVNQVISDYQLRFI